MWGMFGIDLSPESRRMKKEAMDRRTTAAVPWDPDMPWKPELNITASSWNDWVKTWQLFDVEPLRGDVSPWTAKTSQYVDSCGQPTETTFRYVEKVVPGREALSTYLGNRQGTVVYDGDTLLPCLFEAGHTRRQPWMSITPMEVLSLRPGTKLARGHTVIAGLGLGWQLRCVLMKRSVKKVTLVERSAELTDWLLPKILSRIDSTYGAVQDAPGEWRCSVGRKHIEVRCGDAKEIVPAIEADVALIDIFPSYSGNDFVRCPAIGRVWCWGAGELADDGRW